MNQEHRSIDELPLWANWEAQLEDAPLERTIEFTLYGRVSVTELEGRFGPYIAFNTWADLFQTQGGPQPIIVIRAELRTLVEVGNGASLDQPENFDAKGHHGGNFLDEVAALVTLVLGTRIKAGQVIRQISKSDPLGKPTFYQGLRPPYLPERPDRLPVIPNARAIVDVSELNQLNQAIKLVRLDRWALIRAARLYQAALWIADEDTAMAWLLLVSAVETIAHRVKVSEADTRTLLLEAKPDLVRKLDEISTEAVAHVADAFGETLRVSHSFRETVRRFIPEAPSDRPPVFGQIDWEWTKLRKRIDQIYRLRSKALHEGIPFPLPMCEPPMPTTDSEGKQGAPQEWPDSDSRMGVSGWRKDDMPMYIHIFAHITRGVLLNWMRATAEGQEPADAALGLSS